MPSRWDSATCGWRRRVFHYPPPTLMSRNLRLPRAIELRPLSLTPLKMRKVEPEWSKTGSVEKVSAGLRWKAHQITYAKHRDSVPRSATATGKPDAAPQSPHHLQYVVGQRRHVAVVEYERAHPSKRHLAVTEGAFHGVEFATPSPFDRVRLLTVP